MDIFIRLMSKYFWAVALVFTALQVIVIRRNGKRLFAEDAEELDKYNKFVNRFGLYLSFPWVVMGIGTEVGGVETMMHFLRPRDGGFFVIVWWACLYLWWFYALYWVNFSGGAEKAVKYQLAAYDRGFGKLRYVKSALKVKLFVSFMILVLFIVSLTVWFKDMPLPEF